MITTKDYSELLYLKPGQKPTLHYLILSALVEGDEVTVISALQRFKTIELRKIVSDLRAAGVPIADRWMTNPETKKRFKQYFLSE